MKVVVAHNRYVSAMPSGENAVVDAEIEALSRAGVGVVPYLRSSDEISDFGARRKAALAIRPIYSAEDCRRLGELIGRERPDILHVHNPTPLISPAIIRVAHGRGVPTVHTVHNHRHLCVKGTFFRDGRICHDCVGRALPWPAIAHGCYRDSRIQSVPMAASQVVHRRTWQLVDHFFALNDEIVDELVETGIDRLRISLRPNTVADPGQPPDGPRSGFLFVGRLQEEKGIQLLVDAWRRVPAAPDRKLTIVGDGPLRALVDGLASERKDVTSLGPLSPDGVAQQMRQHAALVIPSTCPEVFPRVAVEALANGLPIVAAAVGGLKTIVTPDIGVLVAPTPGSLADALYRGAVAPNRAKAAAARDRFLRFYSETVATERLLDVYQKAVDARP